MKIMLVDDIPLMRDGIASLLRAKGHEVVAEAADGKEAILSVGTAHPDLVLMDVRMPGMGGLEATRAVKALYPDTKIVMLTVSDDERDLFEAIKSGADGYLLKDLTATELFEELDAIGRGEAVVTKRLAGRLLEEFKGQGTSQSRPEDGATLSPREAEVLQLVAGGLSNREVAAQLIVSENTVKYHMKRILEKLHLRSRAQVIAWAAQHLAGGAPAQSSSING